MRLEQPLGPSGQRLFLYDPGGDVASISGKILDLSENSGDGIQRRIGGRLGDPVRSGSVSLIITLSPFLSNQLNMFCPRIP